MTLDRGLARLLTRTVLLASLVGLCLHSCSPAATTAPRPTATEPQVVEATQEVVPIPLAAPGPYHVGRRAVTYEYAGGEGRQRPVTLWHPALRPEEAAGTAQRVCTDCEPDRSGAPYPLLLSSTKVAGVFAPTLVSRGFTWASVDGIDSYDRWNEQLIDQPLALLFVLDQVTANPPEGLEGMIDAEHAGAIGYSFDGYNALALSGARVDPEHYAAQCASAPTLDPAPEGWWIRSICALADRWDEFAAHAGESITSSDDGLWQPMTDARIRAVMPMAPEGAWLFGERGLAAVDRPTLIIGATDDEICPYRMEAVTIYERLGTPDRAMVSFVGRGHMMIYADEPVAQMVHLAAAFFGVHLQGRDEYARYLSEEWVSSQERMAWGVYEGE